MPRTIDPSNIPIGGGHVVPGSVSPSVVGPSEAGPVSGALEVHILNPIAAHEASSVVIQDPYSRYFLGPDVQGALTELAALVPPQMGGVGSDGVAWLGSTNTGVPDWGILKLVDGVIPPTGNTTSNVRGVYPYYYRAPITTSGLGLTGTGLDDHTDPVFNYGDLTYSGGGVGKAHAGFATVSMGGGAASGYPSWRVIPAIVDPAVVVSGIVSPADRGVLALVRWPSGDQTVLPDPLTTTADVLDRCVAAVLLGQGANSHNADGSPGGIFSEASGPARASGTVDFSAFPAAPYTIDLDLTPFGLGTVTLTATAAPTIEPLHFWIGAAPATAAINFSLALNTVHFPQNLVAVPNAAPGVVVITFATPGVAGNTAFFSSSSGAIVFVQPSGGTSVAASPFSLPGRASGQYNLDEIHTGQSTTSGPAPFFNPAAGQVRLLTDPAAFPTAVTPTTPGGIPIFGGTTQAIGTGVPTYLPYGLGGGTDGNFLAYRLPYLEDYAVTTGLPYTPSSEKTRYTTKLLPSSPGALTTAGNYDDFLANFWAFQLARYRHRFTLATGATVNLRRDKSFALVHFKTEEAFESYVRDGVAVTDSQVYSVNLVTWDGVAQVPNLADATTPTAAAISYPVQTSEVEEDPNGSAAPTLVGGSDYTLSSTLASTWYTGIRYLVPRDPAAANTPALGITSLNLGFNGVFNATYRSHDKIPVAGPLSADPRKYALNQNPLFISLASFIYQGDEVLGTSGISTGTMAVFPGSLGEARRQRLELGFADLTSGVLNPAIADTATVVAGAAIANSVTFGGDVTDPVFTSDARVRVFVRRPLGGDTTPGATLGYPLPYVGGNTAMSRGFDIPETVGDIILYHSMKETNAVPGMEQVPYGNPSDPLKAVHNATKDRSERFLDETYRYSIDWAPNPNVADVARLVGSGLPGGVSPVNVRVRPLQGDPDFPGYFYNGYHLDPTYIVARGELQVAGLPARNPDYTEGLTSPFPSRGLLLYPQKDYSTGYVPVGADYSALAGSRLFIRAFDAGLANAGGTTIRIKVWGVQLADFAYSAPGPGGLDLGIVVKVPGKTTWMDAGRADGAGPSKQDVALDGAGCQVVGVNTFDGVDPDTQIVYAQVEVNLGAVGALFANTEVPARCPVLIAVAMHDTVGARAYNFEQGGEDGPTLFCRGIVGLDLIYP